MAGYAVVAFDEENEVSVVPSIWLTDGGTKCYWPSYRNASKVAKAIKEKSSPQENWTMYSARVLSKCGKLSGFPCTVQYFILIILMSFVAVLCAGSCFLLTIL